MQTKFAAFAAAALIGMTGAAFTAQAAVPSEQAQDFMQWASKLNYSEIAEGNLAESRAASPQVKQLGQTFVTDHTQNENQLVALAKQQGVTLPMQPTSKSDQEMASLGKLNGQQFDQKFPRQEAKGHAMAIKRYQREASRTNDAALRQYIETSIPVLEKHLDLAKQAEQAG